MGTLKDGAGADGELPTAVFALVIRIRLLPGRPVAVAVGANHAIRPADALDVGNGGRFIRELSEKLVSADGSCAHL